MTPETRAARDRIVLLLDPDTARFPTVEFRPGSRNPTCEEVYALIVRHDELIRSMIAPDLAVVVAALDRYEAIEDADRRAAQGVASEWAAGRTRREYDPAVRVPRDLDPSDGSVWDLPRDEPDGEGD